MNSRDESNPIASILIRERRQQTQRRCDNRSKSQGLREIQSYCFGERGRGHDTKKRWRPLKVEKVKEINSLIEFLKETLLCRYIWTSVIQNCKIINLL